MSHYSYLHSKLSNMIQFQLICTYQDLVHKPHEFSQVNYFLKEHHEMLIRFDNIFVS